MRLAEKERQRLVKGKAGPPAAAVVVGPSDEELQQLKAKADANMAALLQEEEVKKVTHLLPLHRCGTRRRLHVASRDFSLLQIKLCMPEPKRNHDGDALQQTQ